MFLKHSEPMHVGIRKLEAAYLLQGAIRRSSSVRLRTPPAPSPLGPAALSAAGTPQQARASGTGAAASDRLHPVFGWQASSGPVCLRVVALMASE